MNHEKSIRMIIEEMNRYYEARAPWHDQYMSYTSIDNMEALLSPIIVTCEPMITGKKVLEIACGTGNWTQVLAKRALSVVAVDISSSALEMAKQKLVDYQNVRLIECDAYRLDSIEEKFEAAFSADWWSHIPKRILPDFIASVNRRLYPGSPVIGIDMIFRDVFAKESCYYDSDNNRVSRRTLPDGTPFNVIKNFPGETELRAVLDPFASDIVYYSFDSLKRWGFKYTANSLTRDCD
ncbi:MAG: class I SAM-dependent methyltransferase [candidate division Zixibacteria bacterium]|nr:class I SAM-dependent methyltransferase [candidate division Zixibacteria bacterium]